MTAMVRIISNGRANNTVVTDENNNILRGVTAIKWEWNAAEGMAKAQVTFGEDTVNYHYTEADVIGACTNSEAVMHQAINEAVGR